MRINLFSAKIQENMCPKTCGQYFPALKDG